MDWYAIVFTHAQLSRLDYTKVEDEFQLYFLSEGSPEKMALFALRTFPVHPVYYISPESAGHVGHLLREYDAFRCKQPPFTDIELIAGEYHEPLDVQLPYRYPGAIDSKSNAASRLQ